MKIPAAPDLTSVASTKVEATRTNECHPTCGHNDSLYQPGWLGYWCICSTGYDMAFPRGVQDAMLHQSFGLGENSCYHATKVIGDEQTQGWHDHTNIGYPRHEGHVGRCPPRLCNVVPETV